MTSATAARPAPILLFDGECGLCDHSIQFILRNDSRKVLRFSPLQGETAAPILERHGLQPDEGAGFDSLILVTDPGLPSETVALRSQAALGVTRLMGRRWAALSRFGGLVPGLFRDAVYRWIAARRHRFFPSPDACRVPSRDERARFLP